MTLARKLTRRGAGHRLPAGRGGRLGHHGGASGGRQRRHCAVLANTLATGAGLIALILTFGPISGAHFNPAVTLADAWAGGVAWRDVPAYIVAQLVGAFAGVAAAHGMFDLPLFFASQHERAGPSQLWSEFVATFGLLAVIWGTVKSRPSVTPVVVGCYITAAYWFTASTSFANPAVTLARAASDTFAGIRPLDAPGFHRRATAGRVGRHRLVQMVDSHLAAEPAKT
jgi:glycerol uptake facilitator-like aquaporin